MKTPPLKSFRVENFKAIRDSGRIKFGWLTVLIGNNGCGKSSLVEGLESFRDIAVDGLDFAMRRWHGFEQVWNKAPDRKVLERKGHRPGLSHPMRFRFSWKRDARAVYGPTIHHSRPRGNSLFIQQEQSSNTGPIALSDGCGTTKEKLFLADIERHNQAIQRLS